MKSKEKMDTEKKIREAAHRERYSTYHRSPEELELSDLIDYTIIHKRTEWFWWLMEHNDLVNKKNMFYTKYRGRMDTALTYAASQNLVEISKYLWERGAKVKYYLHDQLLLAIQWNNHDMAELLFGMGARILHKYKFKKYVKMADNRMKKIIGRHLDACPPGSVIELDPLK